MFVVRIRITKQAGCVCLTECSSRYMINLQSACPLPTMEFKRSLQIPGSGDSTHESQLITWMQYFLVSGLPLSVCHVSLQNFLPTLPYLTHVALHSFLSIFLHCHVRYHSFATIPNCLRQSTYKGKKVYFLLPL